MVRLDRKFLATPEDQRPVKSPKPKKDKLSPEKSRQLHWQELTKVVQLLDHPCAGEGLLVAPDLELFVLPDAGKLFTPAQTRPESTSGTGQKSRMNSFSQLDLMSYPVEDYMPSKIRFMPSGWPGGWPPVCRGRRNCRTSSSGRPRSGLDHGDESPYTGRTCLRHADKHCRRTDLDLFSPGADRHGGISTSYELQGRRLEGFPRVPRYPRSNAYWMRSSCARKSPAPAVEPTTKSPPPARRH